MGKEKAAGVALAWQDASCLATVEKTAGEQFTWERKKNKKNAKKIKKAWCSLGHAGLTWASIQT